MTDSTPTLAQRNARANATPMVRRMATEQGVALADVAGTGAGGRVRRQDVLAAVRPVAAPRAVPVAAAASAVSVDPILAANQLNAAHWASEASAGDGAAKNRAFWERHQHGAPSHRSMGRGGEAPIDLWLTQENDAYGTLGGVRPTRDVKELANQLGVRLGATKGTGPGGQHTRGDVEMSAAAQQRARARAQAPAPAAAAPAYVAPPFTASGIDPAQLSSVPESVRPAMAAATSPAEAFRIRERYGSMSNEQARAQLRMDAAVRPEHGGQLTWPG